ncbi:ABC transporter ATP-binding protein [Ruania suaedae]|uniref:ABC transporter ATP-binding protein n=1 Tax=Ruania suaedae TaxID=2897774 RepID=UPI001E3CE261|nr:ABC transporter ATP-binding protein [Ruania suaedae]UFU03252.1 ABC transporter ATP-binding protein [Ruania suaedae]
MNEEQPIIAVENLSVVYEPIGAPTTHAVREVSFTVDRGEFVGLVGESGSGKSTLGFALTKLIKHPARISAGRILVDGRDIAPLSEEELRAQRRGGFAMVLQSGMNALNPVRTIRNHFADIFAAHGHVPPAQRLARARELVQKVELDETVLDRYPGELSGGMRQRVTIALALSLEPQIMVFDEPTTALDVLVQHAVMETIRELQASEGFTAVLISHDLGTVLESTSRVLVMHEGEIVENAPSAQILHRAEHEYTQMLLSHYADPRAEKVTLPGLEDSAVGHGAPEQATGSRGTGGPGSSRAGGPETRLVVENVSKTYPPPRRGASAVEAVRDVSFTLEPGASLALVGQSGSGKSTIAKMLTGVERPSEGTITFGDVSVGGLRRRGLRRLHSDVQMVFQDPYAALNPLHTVEYTLTRPVVNFTGRDKREARRRVLELLDTVGLTPVEEFAAKLPHQLSGGQRQRVVIARALASDPRVIIADEPVSMLDVSLRAGVLSLVRDLRTEWGVSLLYITHDLLSARMVTDDIIVLNAGRIVERGPTAQVMRHPEDEYTIKLLDSIPNPARVHPAA